MSELQMLLDMGFSREKAYVSELLSTFYVFVLFIFLTDKMYSIAQIFKGKKHWNSPATEALNRLWNGC